MKKKSVLISSVFLALTLLISMQMSTVRGYLPPGIPREELFIAENFGGRAITPKRFNVWVLGVTAAPYQAGVHQLMLTALWYFNYSDGSIINGLAASYPMMSEDYTELTIKLKSGIYWSDGVEHTAEDWLYTLNLALTDSRHGFNPHASLWIKNVSAPDKHTVVIKLKQPYPNFWTLFAVGVWSAWIYPMPAHIFKDAEARGIPWYEFDFYPPVSLGPYVLKDLDPTGYWYLWELRSDWERTAVGKWLKEHGLSWTGPRYVLYVAFDTEEQKIAAAGRNEIDYLFDVTAEAFDAIRMLNPYARSVIPHVPYEYTLEPCMRGAYFNLEKYPYNLTEVRWALALSINATDYVISTLRGICKLNPINAIYRPGLFELYEKVIPRLEAFEITLPNGSKFKPYDPEFPLKIARWAVREGYIESMPSLDEARLYWGVGWYKYAPDVAEQLLKSVGFNKGADGKWRLPTGELWHITFYSAGPWEIDGMRMSYGLAEQWRKFGIDVEVKVEDSSTFWSRNFQGFYETGGWWGLGNEGVTIHDWVRTVVQLHSKYAKPSGEWSSNFIRLRDPEIDKLLDEMSSTPTMLPDGTINPKFLDMAADFVMYFIQNMYYVPTQCTKKLAVFDTKYWEGYTIIEEGWRGLWAHYYFAGAQWLIPLLRPRAMVPPVTYITIYALTDIETFTGVDGKTYGPYKAGEAMTIPKDDAERLIREGKASYSPPLPPGTLEALTEILKATARIETSTARLDEKLTNLSGTIDALNNNIGSFLPLLYVTIILQIIVVISLAYMIATRGKKS
ncbi:MAG: ABC transporter substrate-binding protein [Candidatus Bathyarchaeia archaeon]